MIVRANNLLLPTPGSGPASCWGAGSGVAEDCRQAKKDYE